jgi:hypothetical protein
MSTLWVFGDSFSHIHDNSVERRYKFYREYRKGVLPKTWSELLASQLGMKLRNCANRGSSNYDIFQWFCDYSQVIQSNDIVIIGWSFKERFRLVNHNTGQFETIRPNSIQITQTKEFLKNISLSTINEVLLNRTESEWKGEVYSWESLINLLASKIGFNIFYWTFDDTLHKKNYIGGDTNSLMETLLTNGANTITMETNGEVNDMHFGEQGHIIQSNYFYEFLLKNKIIYNE